ncbi:hypothetical protein JXC34_05585, partial [Candidatus Woesearchaeota archaeon]|nr:hypothetical protein [Candidatus Woesearchaeota archaeon]
MDDKELNARFYRMYEEEFMYVRDDILRVAIKALECSQAGGTWATFSNGCADFCGDFDACTAALTDSCDCGPKCWNGTNCI